MIRMTTKVKVAAAFKLLQKYGIHCCVPGWYDISTAEEAVQFADNPEAFYESHE